jgi:hypothetical protein
VVAGAFFVIEPDKMQKAVNDQGSEFAIQAVAAGPGLAEGRGDGDDEIAQIIPPFGALLLDRKAQNIGGPVQSPVLPIESPDGPVSGQDKRDVGFLMPVMAA